MPKPHKGESKEEYISRFMASEEAQKSYPDEKQRAAVAYSMWKEHHSKREISQCQLPILLREQDGEYYTEGWIYTTHPDRANDGDPEVSNTVFSKRCMEQIVEAINVGGAPITMSGARRAVSIQHDWIKEGDASIEPIGMAMPGAELRQTEDGQWGVWGKTRLNRMHPEFEAVKYKIETGILPGHSIEFIEGDSEKVSVAGRMIKVIKSLKEFLGYALAGARLIANPKAEIKSFGYREIEMAMEEKDDEDSKVCKKCNKKDCKCKEKEEGKEETRMTEETQVQAQTPIAEPLVREAEPVAQAAVEAPQVRELTQEELDVKIRESKAYKELMDSIEVKSRVLKTGTKEENTMEDIKLREMNNSLGDVKQFREIATDYLNETGIINKALAECGASGYKGFGYNTKVRVTGKGVKVIGIRANLDTATNVPTYTQQPVEMADVFAPGLNDIFNSETPFFSFLGKEAWNSGYYQWKNVTDRNPGDVTAAVDRDDVNIITQGSTKFNLQTPLKVYRMGVDVTDFIQRYSAQSIGDLFMREVELKMKEMMVEIEADLFDEVADGTGNHILGLEAVADVTGNTTLYGLTRSTTNQLTTGTLADTYVNVAAAISEAAIRLGIGKLRNRGVKVENMALVTSPIGKNFIFNLLDTNRRFNTVSAEFGFNQKVIPSYDGIPVIESWKCGSTLAAVGDATSCCAFIIDQEQDKIIVGMEPRLINLAKVNAGTQAYVETHIAHVYKDPRKIYMIDNFITG